MKAKEKDSQQESSRTITITQCDVREVQLAKGAMRVGITTLLHNLGREEEDIEALEWLRKTVRQATKPR